MFHRSILLSLLALAACVGASSSWALDHTLVAVRAAKPVKVDGQLDPEEWKGAGRADAFVQFQPHPGEPATDRTEAYVSYDDRYLYVAFRCFDDAPGRIVAQLTRRDSDLLEDDAVLVLLDTFADRRTAYYFFTNPLGTQADGRINDNGRVVEGNWDGSWRSATARFEGGWTAEMAIPFAGLRFKPGADQRWGLNLGRSARRRLETSFWSPPSDDRFRVSSFGTLSGLDLRTAQRRYEMVPYVLSRFQEGTTPDYEVGGDLRVAITPENVANVTVNPDFATVEADQEQVNLTRFEVSLQEKRPFFLEGSEQFHQRLQTFYSRRIAEIRGGAKALGRVGGFQYAALTAQSEPIPIAKGSPVLRSANYAVLGVQRPVARASSVGFVVANRHLAGEDRGAIGIDTSLLFPHSWGLTGQVVRSHGPETGGRWGFFLRPARETSSSHVHLRYTSLGDQFGDHVNAIGLVKDDDRRELDSAVEKTFWIRKGPWERIGYDSNYNVYWSQTGRLRSWQIDESVDVDFRSRWSAELEHTEEYKLFEKRFRNRKSKVDLGYNTREWQSVSASYEFGRNFDSDYDLVGLEIHRKVTPRGSLEYELQRLWLDPDPEREATVIHVVKASYNFTKDLYLRTFFQTNSAIDRRNLQAVFVWRYRPPFGSIQLAFQRGTAAFGQHSAQGNTFFAKISSVF